MILRPPSTRYQGSKEKLVEWIWGAIRNLKFDTFLDALGGTGSVGFWAKVHRKTVTYNDVFRSNYYVGLAIIENDSTTLTPEDVSFLLSRHEGIRYQTFIQDTYKGIYYTDEENAWLDTFVANLREIDNIYKRAVALSSLFQACLVKRPYNLFHRANLYMRLAEVKRGFGNKVTWERPFPIHFRNFVKEYNSCIFSNSKRNRALNLDAFDIPSSEEYDLVYIDPPYYSRRHGPTDYYSFYHFLEGLCTYLERGAEEWARQIDYKRKPKPLKHGTELEKKNLAWMKEGMIHNSFDKLFRKFKDSILVVSYNSEGVPSEEEIIRLLEKYKENVMVKRKKYQYALSPIRKLDELLFIGL